MKRVGRIACCAAAYGAIAWVAVRLTAAMAARSIWPPFLPDTVPMVLALAFKPVLVLAWLRWEEPDADTGASAAARAVAATGGVARAIWSICRRLVAACYDAILIVFGRRT